MPRSGQPTRRLLLDTAERLFATHGLEAVSLRDIAATAGQLNHSAVQYHFGDRAGLVTAIFERRMETVNERRTHIFAARAGADATLEDLVEAVIRPVVEVVSESNSWYGRFLAHTLWDPVAARLASESRHYETMRVGLAQIDESLGDLPAGDRQRRMALATALVVSALAGWEWARDRGEPTDEPNLLIAELVSICVAVLTAPLTRTSRDALPERAKTIDS